MADLHSSSAASLAWIRLLIFALVFLVLILAACLIPGGSFEYPLVSPLESYSCHVQQFDAFHKGQFELDIVPDPILATLVNPYDRQERDASKAHYLWDRCYYQGSYYSYFGIAPILLVYEPFYLLTGRLPSNLAASFLLCFGACILIAFVLLEFMNLAGVTISRWRFLLYYLAVLAAGLLLLPLVYQDHYYLVYQCMMLAFSGFVLALLRISRHTAWQKQAVYLFAAGCCCALILFSRPQVLLFCLILAAPVFWKTLRDRSRPVLKLCVQACSFLVPFLIAVIWQFFFNNARFGKPLDFGAFYQLTVSDIRNNHLRLSAIMPSIKAYYLHPPALSSQFPWLRFAKFQGGEAGIFLYTDKTLGILNFPFLLFGLYPIFQTNNRGKSGSRIKWLIYALAAFFIAWFDYCLAGSNLRYVCDISLPLVLMAAWGGILMDKQFLADPAAARNRIRPGRTGASGNSVLTQRFYLSVSAILLVWSLILGIFVLLLRLKLAGVP